MIYNELPSYSYAEVLSDVGGAAGLILGLNLWLIIQGKHQISFKKASKLSLVRIEYFFSAIELFGCQYNKGSSKNKRVCKSLRRNGERKSMRP